MDFLDHTVTERFVEREHRSMILMDDDPERLLRKFEAYQPPLTDKEQWVLRFSQAET